MTWEYVKKKQKLKSVLMPRITSKAFFCELEAFKINWNDLRFSIREISAAEISPLLLASGSMSVFRYLCQGDKLINRQNKSLETVIELKL